MASSDLAYIEQVVKNGFTNATTKQTEELFALGERLNGAGSAQQLLWILDESTDVMTVQFASRHMQQMFTECINSFSVPDRRQIRQMLLNILMKRLDWFCRMPIGGMPHTFALYAFAALLARVWRICWFEIEDNIDVTNSDSDSEGESDWWSGTTAKASGSSMSTNMSGTTSTNINGRNTMASSDESADDPLLHVVAKRMIMESPTRESSIVGLQLLLASVEEMTKNLPSLWPAAQRKTVIAFRDRSLYDIFKIGISTMQKLLVTPMPMTEPAKSQQGFLVNTTLDLVSRVFAFDFVGTIPDESSDEVGIIHIPSTWSSTFENLDTMRTFVNFYVQQTGVQQEKALDIISSFVAVRSSVFGSSASQAKFLESFFDNIGKVLSDKIGLGNAMNRHNMCRMLVRLKCNFQLSQFVAVPTWKALAELLANFHMEILGSDETSPSLIYYIMTWWQRVCHAVSYLSSNSEPSHLNEIIPAILKTFIQSQLKHEEENPDQDSLLTDRSQFPLVLNTLPSLLDTAGRVEIMTGLIDLFNQYGLQFTQLSGPYANTNQQALNIVERQLAFLVHVVTHISPDRGSSSSTKNLLDPLGTDSGGMDGDAATMTVAEQTELLDNDLVSCVFNLLQVHDERIVNHRFTNSSDQLEYALACFLRQFAAAYFGNDEIEKSKLHQVLEQRHGLRSRENVLDAILNKIAMNLKNWPFGTEVAKETLQLFLALVNGRASSRLIFKSELVAYLIGHHVEIDLGSNERNRREFYRVLGRIAFKESDYSEEPYTFLEPFDQKFMNIRSGLQVANDGQLAALAPEISMAFCDLRGALSACTSVSGFQCFFDWFYPSGYYESICLVAIQRYAGYDWSVIWKVLRFVEEFVTNSHKRISFPSASTDGHRLFRDTAHLLIALAGKIMEMPNSAQLGIKPGMLSMSIQSGQPSSEALTQLDQQQKAGLDNRYKAILLYLQIFSRLISGANDFANLGVYALFGDKIVYELFFATTSVICSMDLDEAQAYSKVVDVLYVAIETMCLHNLTDLLSEELNSQSDALSQVLMVLKRGLRSKVVRTVCCCTQAIDKICTYQFLIMRKRRRPDQTPTIFTDAHAAYLGEIMFELVDLVLEDVDMIHWTLCRPLFVLIQILPETFARIHDVIFKSQAHLPDKLPKLEEAWKGLSNGLDNSLRADNREKFTSNAMEMKNALKTVLDFKSLNKEMLAFSGANIGGNAPDGMTGA